MKKFFKILFALIIIAVLGVVALITFIDPNEYRGYMVQQVKEKTGYQLELNGDLRWHVWPQVSILVDGVTLTAPDAQAAMVQAQNMRLDVELVPLFSKQLEVKEVLLKGAVIRLTDKTQTAKTTNNTEQSTHHSNTPSEENNKKARDWTLGLERLEIADSTVVLQQSANPDDLLTVRNINALLTKQSEHHFDIKTDLSINRNQNDAATSLKGSLDLTAFPQTISAVIDELTYQLQGSDFPANGIAGSLSANVAYGLASQQLAVSNLNATANDNAIEGSVNMSLNETKTLSAKLNAKTAGGSFTGDISGSLGDIPDIVMNLVGTDVDVDKLMNSFNAQNKSAQTNKPKAEQGNSTSTNSKNEAPTHELAFLNSLNAKLSLKANSLMVNGLTLNNLVVSANNQQGNVQLDQISAGIFGGTVNTSGSINAKGNQPAIQLNPKITNVDMDSLTKTFELTPMLSGKLNMNGKVAGTGFDANAIKTNWTATLNTQVNDARLNNLNLQQIIHQAAALSSRDINAEERYDQYTQLQTLSMVLQLQKGTAHLNNIDVDSKALVIKGNGTVKLADMSCNMSLNTKLLQGWSGKKDVVEILQSTTIPVHIYGPCDHLSYKVDADKLFKDQLQQQATKALDKYLGGSAQKKQDAVDKVFTQILGKK